MATNLAPMFSGGGQEMAVRPGTENLLGVVSFGLRVEKLVGEGSGDYLRVKKMREQLVASLNSVAGVGIHALEAENVGNTVSLYLSGCGGEDLLLQLENAGIVASGGSACNSGLREPSHVLLALGASDWAASNSVRLSLGPSNELRDIERMVSVIKAAKASHGAHK